MKYAHYDKTDGKLLGWYDSEIHAEIPTPNIQVGNEVWEEAINNNYNCVDVPSKTLNRKDFRTLEETKNFKINEINAACAKEIINGFRSDALGNTRVYQSEQLDQLNLIGVVTAGQDDYFKCGVEDANGSVTWNYESHTIEQLRQVLADGKTHKQSLLQKANMLKQQIKETATIEEVEKIVW